MKVPQRSTFAVARFASSAARQQSLKERLSELIPAELENVRLLYTLDALNTEHSIYIPYVGQSNSG